MPFESLCTFVFYHMPWVCLTYPSTLLLLGWKHTPLHFLPFFHILIPIHCPTTLISVCFFLILLIAISSVVHQFYFLPCSLNNYVSNMMMFKCPKYFLFVWSDEQPCCFPNHELCWCQLPGQLNWKVGSSSWHLSMYAQL